MPRPERKLNRCPGFDYSLNGCYFVTTCVQNFVCCFGKIENNQMILNQFGEIVKQQLLWLPEHFPYIRLNEWCVMPNHAHAIVVIDRANIGTERAGGANGNAGGVIVGTGLDLSLRLRTDVGTSSHTTILSLSHVIGAFKTTSSKLIHQSGLTRFRWQRSFHDRIIRDNEALEAIRWYIQNNPARWRRDRNNLNKN